MTDPTTPFRTVVGADGELIAATERRLTFDEFAAARRGTVHGHD